MLKETRELRRIREIKRRKVYEWWNEEIRWIVQDLVNRRILVWRRTGRKRGGSGRV